MDLGTLTLIMQGIIAAVREAPHIFELAAKAKEFIEVMFKHGLITEQQQWSVFNQVDDITKKAQEGKLGPHWEVESDPDPDD